MHAPTIWGYWFSFELVTTVVNFCKEMKRKFFIIGLLVCIGSISCCKDFLDVRPDNQVFEKDLFVDRSGFETALAGVYTTL